MHREADDPNAYLNEEQKKGTTVEFETPGWAWITSRVLDPDIEKFEHPWYRADNQATPQNEVCPYDVEIGIRPPSDQLYEPE